MGANQDCMGARARVLALVFCAMVPAILVAGPLSTQAASSCRSRTPEVPCLGPLQSEYDYAGGGYGALSYVWAKAGPEEPLTVKAPPTLPKRFAYQRTFTIHTRAGIQLMGVYELRGGAHGHYRYKRLLPNHGKVTLDEIHGLPILLLEARRDPKAAPEHHKPSCPVREVPCLGQVQTLFDFNGKIGGAASLIHFSAGAEEAAGTAPNGKLVMQRTVSWTSASNVQLVAAYVLRLTRNGGKTGWHIQRVPTGSHSGHATLTTEPENPEPNPTLLVEGRQA